MIIAALLALAVWKLTARHAYNLTNYLGEAGGLIIWAHRALAVVVFLALWAATL